MPASRCPNHDAFHRGAWSFCPWCGGELEPRRRPPPAGICRQCGREAAAPTIRWCRPCWYRRVAARLIGGRTLEALAAARASGASWADIARQFDMPGPRRGPADVERAADLFWDAAGSPGWPAPPDALQGTPRGDDPALDPLWRAWRERWAAALDAWLTRVASRGTIGTTSGSIPPE